MNSVAPGFWDFVWILLIVVLAVSGLAVYRQPKERGSLARLEAKINLLLEHAGLAYDPVAKAPSGVLEALQRGEKIKAIKLYRQATGVGLAEAKDCVEELQAQIRNR